VGTASFFIPGVVPGDRREEAEYLRLCQCAEAASGGTVAPRRIQQIFCRIESRDCEVEVGRPDPIHGAQVVAILDLGRHLPFHVFTTADPHAPSLLVGPSVYWVTVFR
jgi:hypothetical protein